LVKLAQLHHSHPVGLTSEAKNKFRRRVKYMQLYPMQYDTQPAQGFDISIIVNILTQMLPIMLIVGMMGAFLRTLPKRAKA